MTEYPRKLDRKEILKILPHKERFMFLESAEIIEPGRAIGKLAKREDFDYLRDHSFPHAGEIFPGALTGEVLAELLGLTLTTEQTGVLADMHIRPRGEIKPSDEVFLDAQVIETRGKFVFGTAKATVDGKIVATVKLILALEYK
ncbi:MAG: hypothetical protein A2W22_06660 [Candidatus Levybacteria bacterium RBG_16_35_11]|nr:MAG: hypothetical protein A2W22_06660 [Candidatus Levybacteria bacterium RBG_16_35_11]